MQLHCRNDIHLLHKFIKVKFMNTFALILNPKIQMLILIRISYKFLFCTSLEVTKWEFRGVSDAGILSFIRSGNESYNVEEGIT